MNVPAQKVVSWLLHMDRRLGGSSEICLFPKNAGRRRGPGRESVARRLKRERDLTAAGMRRAYNALLRAGFPAAELYAELKRQRDALDDLTEHEYQDESP